MNKGPASIEDIEWIPITSWSGETLEIGLVPEYGRFVGMFFINGIPCHLERIRVSELLSKYKVDQDPGYIPMADRDGFTYIVVPFMV